MKLGSFEIPELRLIPTALEILEEIYKIKHRERVGSKDIALLLGYKYGTEPHFYRKLKTLISYGLLEGQGNFTISSLGEQILYPKTDEERQRTRTKAIMSVKFWEEIYKKHGKNPRQDNFWAVLNDVAKLSPDKAKAIQGKIFKWYSDDMAHVVEKYVDDDNPIVTETKDLRSGYTNQPSLQQELVPPVLANNQDHELIQFGKASLSLPKKDLAKQWKKLQRYMEIFLEDYEEPKSKGVELKNLDIETQDVMEENNSQEN